MISQNYGTTNKNKKEFRIGHDDRYRLFSFYFLGYNLWLVSPTVREYQNSSVNLKSKNSYYLAESGVEDAMYRIAAGKTIGASETITLGSNSETTTITTTGSNQKEIVSLGNVSNYQRKMDMILQGGAGVGFNYGIQSGDGGLP